VSWHPLSQNVEAAKGLLVEVALAFLGWDLVGLVGGYMVLQPHVGWEVGVEVVAFRVGGLVDYFGVLVELVAEKSNGAWVVA